MGDDSSRRRVLVRVTANLFEMMMTHDRTFRCVTGLPDGAKLIRVGLSEGPPGEKDFMLLFEHGSFQSVQEGEWYPDMRIEFELLN